MNNPLGIKTGDLVATPEAPADMIKVIGVTFCGTRFYGSRCTADGKLRNNVEDRIIYGMWSNQVIYIKGTAEAVLATE